MNESWHLDEGGHDVWFPVEHGEVQRGPLLVVDRVHLRPLVHQRQDGLRPAVSLVRGEVT